MMLAAGGSFCLLSSTPGKLKSSLPAAASTTVPPSVLFMEKFPEALFCFSPDSVELAVGDLVPAVPLTDECTTPGAAESAAAPCSAGAARTLAECPVTSPPAFPELTAPPSAQATLNSREEAMDTDLRTAPACRRIILRQAQHSMLLKQLMIDALNSPEK